MEEKQIDTNTTKKISPSFLLISGSNINKRKQILLQQIINRDHDIYKLIKKARLRTWYRSSKLVLYGLLIASVSYNTFITKTITLFTTKWAGSIFLLFLAVSLGLAFADFRKQYILINKEVGKGIAYNELKRTISCQKPRLTFGILSPPALLTVKLPHIHSAYRQAARLIRRFTAVIFMQENRICLMCLSTAWIYGGVSIL